MFRFFLKKLGYLHITEIVEVLNEEAEVMEKTPPYNPYRPKSTAWWQQHYANKETAREIRSLKLAFKLKL